MSHGQPFQQPRGHGQAQRQDGRQRREAEDAPPEEKRLRLGLEGGSAAREEGEDAPRLGREETGTQTGVEDGGVSERGRRRDGVGAGVGAGLHPVGGQLQVGNWAATPACGRCGSLWGPPEKLDAPSLVATPFLFM